MPPELLDLESTLRNVQQRLALQRVACDVVGIGVMVFCNAVAIAVSLDIERKGHIYPCSWRNMEENEVEAERT